METTRAGLTSTRAVFAILAAVLFFGKSPEVRCETARESAGRDIVVVVNKLNPVETLSDKELANIFLGKKSVWSAGTPIVTCDLVEPGMDEKNTAMALFAEKFLHKDMVSLKSYWIKMIFSARRRPPLALGHPEDVIRFVSENRGGIGYVYAGQATEEVKVVRVRPSGDR